MRERIRKLMESKKMTQQTFAEFIGISPASMSSIFNGRTNPTINTVEAIKRKFPRVSTDWLVFGVEPMYMQDATAADAPGEQSAQSPSGDLFAEAETAEPVEEFRQGGLILKKPVPKTTAVPAANEVEQPARPTRTITEIRVFFNDQTYESFVPKK